jgi:hypothetical protein
MTGALARGRFTAVGVLERKEDAGNTGSSACAAAAAAAASRALRCRIGDISSNAAGVRLELENGIRTFPEDSEVGVVERELLPLRLVLRARTG